MLAGQVGVGPVGEFQVGAGADAAPLPPDPEPSIGLIVGQVGAGQVGGFQVGAGTDAGLPTPPDPEPSIGLIVGQVGAGQVGGFQVSAGAEIPPIEGSPGAPNLDSVTDNGDGTLTFAFTTPVDPGESAIINYTAVWNGGSSQTGATSPIVIALHHGENLRIGSGTVYATNTQGRGPDSLPSAIQTPTHTDALYFTRTITWPFGTALGVGLAYRIVDLLDGDLTGWIATGMTATTNMSDPPGVSINFAIPKNRDVSFNGYIEARNQATGSLYQRRKLNLYTAEVRGATVCSTEIHTFLPADTIGDPTVRVFTNNGSAEVTDIAETITGVTEVSVADKCYAYDVELAPDVFGGLQRFIRWGTAVSGHYDHAEIFVPAIDNVSGRLNVAFAFHSTITPGVVSWIARHLVGGVPTNVGTWSTAGVVATAGMTSGAGQSKGYTVNAAIGPNNANNSFSGVILVRASSTGPYDVFELNTQANNEADDLVRLTKLGPFFPTDAITTVGRRTYQNEVGTLTAMEAHQTTGIAEIDEIPNAFFTDLSFAPAIDGSLDVVLVWDNSGTTYVQDTGHVSAYAGVAVSGFLLRRLLSEEFLGGAV